VKIAFVSVHTCPMAELGQKDTGGMNVYLRETAKDLGRRGICVDVFTRVHNTTDPMIVPLGENARVIHLRAGEPDTPKDEIYGHLPEFTRALEEFVDTFDLDYDLAHSHYWLSGPPTLALCEPREIPAVASLHSLGKKQQLVHAAEPESEERLDIETRIVQSADRLVAASPDEQEQLVRLYCAEPDETRVVPCGYNEKIFYPRNQEAARKELGLQGPKIVLFVGRMTRLKGIDILLRAVAAMDGKQGVETVIIGGNQNDAELEHLQKLARELEIEARLRFQGAVPQSTLPLYYSAADVCVVPSYYETFGLVALEAMACGTPVVAARVGGLRATVADGKTGYLVPWHCPGPYAQRLETILGNDVLRASLGKAAVESVQGLTWSFAADNLLDVYGQMLGRKKELIQLIPCA